MEYKPLTTEEESIGQAIVNAAYKIHKELGPDLPERVYEVCMADELRKAGFDVKRGTAKPYNNCIKTAHFIKALISK